MPETDPLDDPELVVVVDDAAFAQLPDATCLIHPENRADPFAYRRSANTTKRRQGKSERAIPDDVPRSLTTTVSAQDLAVVLRFAWSRLDTPEGMQALTAIHATDPALVALYQFGYLPTGYRDLLPAGISETFQGVVGNSLIAPAWDDALQPVDVLSVQMASGQVRPSLADAPLGILAARALTACPSLVLTDSVRRLGSLWSPERPPLLVRSVAEITAQAARIAASRVRTVDVRTRRHADAYAAALRAVGITVTISTDARDRRPAAARRTLVALSPSPAQASDLTPSTTESSQASARSMPAVAVVSAPAAIAAVPSPAVDRTADLELVQHDADAETITYRYGALTLTLDLPWGGSLNVRLRIAAGGQEHASEVDLAVPVQHRRFALIAAARVGQPVALVTAAIGRVATAVQEHLSAATTTGDGDAMPRVSPATLARLRGPDLLPGLLADLDALGWHGDPTAATIGLLTVISRIDRLPLAIALTASDPAETFPMLGLLVAITPDDACIHPLRLTETTLTQIPDGALSHRLLCLDDAHGIPAGLATALTVLRTTGVLTSTRLVHDPVHGDLRTRFVTTRGPVAILTAARDGVPGSLRHHLWEVPLDESPTLRAQRHERHLARLVAGPEVDAARLAQVRAVVAALRKLPVVLPGIGPESIPPPLRTNTVLHAAWISLVRASVLLHQEQRPRIDGGVAATAEDVALATRLVLDVIARSGTAVPGLGRPATRLLQVLLASGRREVTMTDLAELCPTWCRWSLRNAVDALVEMDYLATARAGRGGRRVFTVLVTPTPASKVAGCIESGGYQPATLNSEVVNG
jgi:hypothetical protein